MITEVNKKNAAIVNEAIKKALASVEAEYGVTVEIQGGKFSPDTGEFLPKLVVKVAGSEKTAWENSVGLLRSNWPDQWLHAADFGAEITVNGKQFTLHSIDLKKPKFAIGIKQVSDGTVYGVTEDAVKYALGR